MKEDDTRRCPPRRLTEMVTARAQANIDIDGLSVFYETQGDGEPVVLLHGGLADNSTWAAQFAGLSPHRRVVAPERQAQGHTPDRPGPLTYQAMADQTMSFLVALGLGSVDLVGWSDGGMVGLLLAAERPELVRTLAVTGSGFSSAGYVPGAMEALLALAPDDDDMVMFAAMYAQASPDGPNHFPEVWEKMRAMWAEPFDWTEKAQQISAPTLVIVGDDDYISVSHAEDFARIVEHGQLAVVPGASHLLPMEKPALFNQLVLDFTADPVPETMMPLWREATG
jgi:pimeloyl-ACP methyl ester carboxylesterase